MTHPCCANHPVAPITLKVREIKRAYSMAVPFIGLTTIDARQWPNGIVASNRSAPIPRDRMPTSTSTTHTKVSITPITILGPSRSHARSEARAVHQTPRFD